MERPNSVDYLLSNPFSCMTVEEKCSILQLGRDMPNIFLTQNVKDRGGKYVRKFSRSSYDYSNWLTASVRQNSLYCFPCLLFGGDNLWTTKGFTDIRHLGDKAKRHSKTSLHLNNIVKLAILGTSNIASAINNKTRANIIKHNEEVKRNRHVLAQIIEAILFCGRNELSFQGHNGSQDYLKPCIFKDVMHSLIAQNDPIMIDHFQNATVFKGALKNIQIEILDCILNICQETIIKEIANSTYLAIQYDDTRDISMQAQSAITFRYLNKHKIVERFFTFTDLKGSTAEDIAANVVQTLDLVLSLFDRQKLIAQSYDAAIPMARHKTNVQMIIKEQFTNAHYVHCYAHEINLIIEKISSKIVPICTFFCKLSRFSNFFSNSKRLNVLTEIINGRVPRPSQMDWNFQTKIVNTIYQNREDLINVFSAIVDSCNFDQNSISEASNLQMYLEDFEFIYFLFFFHQIFLIVDILFGKLQYRNCTMASSILSMECFKKEMICIRASCPEIHSNLPPNLTKKAKPLENIHTYCIEACDYICSNLAELFSFTSHLSCAKLMDLNSFQDFTLEFPNNTFSEVIAAYPMLNSDHLKVELEVLYKIPEISNLSDTISLFQFITKNKLDGFSETLDLLEIILTTPMTTSESGRCFSTLKQIKNFLRSTMSESHLNALAMISIEQDLIHDIEDFKDLVIDKFSLQKDWRVNFTYKAL